MRPWCLLPPEVWVLGSGLVFILCQPGSKGGWIEPQRCAAPLTELDIGQAIFAHQVMQPSPADFEQLHYLLVSQQRCCLRCSLSRSALCTSSCGHGEYLPFKKCMQTY